MTRSRGAVSQQEVTVLRKLASGVYTNSLLDRKFAKLRLDQSPKGGLREVTYEDGVLTGLPICSPRSVLVLLRRGISFGHLRVVNSRIAETQISLLHSLKDDHKTLCKKVSSEEMHEQLTDAPPFPEEHVYSPREVTIKPGVKEETRRRFLEALIKKEIDYTQKGLATHSALQERKRFLNGKALERKEAKQERLAASQKRRQKITELRENTREAERLERVLEDIKNEDHLHKLKERMLEAQKQRVELLSERIVAAKEEVANNEAARCDALILRETVERQQQAEIEAKKQEMHLLQELKHKEKQVARNLNYDKCRHLTDLQKRRCMLKQITVQKQLEDYQLEKTKKLMERAEAFKLLNDERALKWTFTREAEKQRALECDEKNTANEEKSRQHVQECVVQREAVLGDKRAFAAQRAECEGRKCKKQQQFRQLLLLESVDTKDRRVDHLQHIRTQKLRYVHERQFKQRIQREMLEAELRESEIRAAKEGYAVIKAVLKQGS